MLTGLPYPGKVLAFLLSWKVLEFCLSVLESPWKYLGGFSCFTGTE